MVVTGGGLENKNIMFSVIIIKIGLIHILFTDLIKLLSTKTLNECKLNLWPLKICKYVHPHFKMRSIVNHWMELNKMGRQGLYEASSKMLVLG